MAQGGPPGAGKVEWAKAVVVTDGGSVYSEPDFDAKVAEYLSVKTPIWASRTAVAGKGGLGLFHRIHYGNKTGYMADVDIRMTDLQDTTVEMRPEKPSKKQKRIKSKATQPVDVEDDPAKKQESLYFTHQIGGSFALTDFTEKFENHTFRSNMGMLGLRMIGPGVLFDGPPLDFNVLVAVFPMVPSYYKSFTKSTTGFMTMGDLNLTLPFAEQPDWLISYGFGLMWVYTNYKVTISESRFDSQEFRIGIDADVGGAYRFGPKHMFSVRGDAKYYFEKTRYYGLMFSFLTEY